MPYCAKPGCDKTYEVDPVFQVGCPRCGAEPGKKCKRPSGHVAWDPKSNLPRGAHRDRDYEALRQGAYGTCPLGICPEIIKELENPPETDGNPTEQAAIGDF